MADYVGLTTPWKIKGWTSEFLRYNNVACESTYVYGEFEAARGGTGAHFGRGGLSHDPQLSSHRQHADGAHPNHWISSLGTLHIDEGVWMVHNYGHISFDCHSWGRTRHVEVGEVTFEDYRLAWEKRTLRDGDVSTEPGQV